MENGQLTAEQINAMITQAVNDAVAPIIEGIKGYSNPQPKPEEQAAPEEELSEAVKAYIDGKQPQQRPAQQQRSAQAQQRTPQEQGPADEVSEATKQWLQHKEEGKDQGKEF